MQEQSSGHKTASQQAFDMAAVPEPLDIEEPFHGPTDQYEGCDFSEDEGVSNFDGDKSVFLADGQESRVISGTSSSRFVSPFHLAFSK